MTNTSVETGAPPPSILIVEDNFLTATEVCGIVRESGYAVAGPVARVKNGLNFAQVVDDLVGWNRKVRGRPKELIFGLQAGACQL